MAKDIKQKRKICRKYGENIFGIPKLEKVLSRKPYAPGQHGAQGRRVKLTEYGLQLKEKQKAKLIYGILEKQFRNTYDKAKKDDGLTGENLIVRLESRLDSVVNRLGFAPTQRAARQLVSHCHFLVNGKSVNIPSFTVKANDKITVKEKSRKMEIIHDSLKRVNDQPTPYLRLDKANMEGQMIETPKRSDIPVNVNEQLIVELYSK